VVIATGAEYRKPPLENLSRFEGAGVYYGATFVEAQVCSGEEVIVVGGGNSAGQAAVFLAGTTKRVHMLVRSSIGTRAGHEEYVADRVLLCLPGFAISPANAFEVIASFEADDFGAGPQDDRRSFLDSPNQVS
jgi:cation diffusion facilitator CzcD-associated flavoprotein CzcO